MDSDVNKWITYKTVKNTELSTVFYWFYTVYAQDFICLSVFCPHFINSVWISKMWVFYVDIYVNKNKNFFSAKKPDFYGILLDIMEIFLYNQDAVFQYTGI